MKIGLKSANILGDFTVAIFHTQTENDIVSAENDNGRSTFRNADKNFKRRC